MDFFKDIWTRMGLCLLLGTRTPVERRQVVRRDVNTGVRRPCGCDRTLRCCLHSFHGIPSSPVTDSAHFIDGQTETQPGQGPGLQGGRAGTWTLLPRPLIAEPFFHRRRVQEPCGAQHGSKGAAGFGQGLGRGRGALGLVGRPQPCREDAESHWVTCSGRFQAPRWASGHKQERAWGDLGPWSWVQMTSGGATHVSSETPISASHPQGFWPDPLPPSPWLCCLVTLPRVPAAWGPAAGPGATSTHGDMEWGGGGYEV